MSTLLTVLHVVVCGFLILTILLQSGKGGGMGAAFGGGNAATVFGGSGASSFLKRATAGAGVVFMLTSMVLAFLASHNSADALEKFGEQQEKLATEKEAAKKKALGTGSGSGSAAGSGSAVGSGSATGSASAAPTGMTPMTPVDQGSGNAHDVTQPTPAETPTPVTKPDQKANPSTPSGMSATPEKANDKGDKAAAPAVTPPNPKAPNPAESKLPEKPTEPTATKPAAPTPPPNGTPTPAKP